MKYWKTNVLKVLHEERIRSFLSRQTATSNVTDVTHATPLRFRMQDIYLSFLNRCIIAFFNLYILPLYSTESREVEVEVEVEMEVEVEVEMEVEVEVEVEMEVEVEVEQRSQGSIESGLLGSCCQDLELLCLVSCFILKAPSLVSCFPSLPVPVIGCPVPDCFHLCPITSPVCLFLQCWLRLFRLGVVDLLCCTS